MFSVSRSVFRIETPCRDEHVGGRGRRGTQVNRPDLKIKIMESSIQGDGRSQTSGDPSLVQVWRDLSLAQVEKNEQGQQLDCPRNYVEIEDRCSTPCPSLVRANSFFFLSFFSPLWLSLNFPLRPTIALSTTRVTVLCAWTFSTPSLSP